MPDMTEPRHAATPARAPRDGISAQPRDESRLAMMRRVKRMTVEQRLDLFEQLSRDAAWALGAKRVR